MSQVKEKTKCNCDKCEGARTAAAELFEASQNLSIKDRAKNIISICKKNGTGEPWVSIVRDLLAEVQRLEEEIEFTKEEYE